MYQIIINDEDLKKATTRYEFNNLKNSITKGESEIYGALGEVMVLNYYKNKAKVIDKSSFNYDLILNGFTVEVKTKKIKYPPKENYIVSVAASNATQNCNYYYFTMVHNFLKRGWLLGYMSREDFFKKAVFCKKGEKDILHKNNNFIIRSDCWSIKISDITNRIE
jgi:hypothetical protein